MDFIINFSIYPRCTYAIGLRYLVRKSVCHAMTCATRETSLLSLLTLGAHSFLSDAQYVVLHLMAREVRCCGTD